MPYFGVIKAAGHFIETQNGAYISAGLNIVITIALVFKYGLIGTASGTLVAMLYHTCYFVWYLQKCILERPVKFFIRYLITDAVIAVTSFVLAQGFVLDGVSYAAWVVLALKVSGIVVAVSAVVNFTAYRQQIKSVISLLRRR